MKAQAGFQTQRTTMTESCMARFTNGAQLVNRTYQTDGRLSAVGPEAVADRPTPYCLTGNASGPEVVSSMGIARLLTGDDPFLNGKSSSV